MAGRAASTAPTTGLSGRELSVSATTGPADTSTVQPASGDLAAPPRLRVADGIPTWRLAGDAERRVRPVLGPGRALDVAYAYVNWWLSGWPGAVMARQGYSM